MGTAIARKAAMRRPTTAWQMTAMERLVTMALSATETIPVTVDPAALTRETPALDPTETETAVSPVTRH
jgi:hypothetical protein